MKEVDKINRLAELGFKIVQPNGYKPYAVERLFREAVKSVTEMHGIEMSEKDYKATISGRIQKTIERMDKDQAFIPERNNHDAKAAESDEFADYFVKNILIDICNCKPGRLKKMSNNLADGYYASTLRLKRQYWDEKNQKKEEIK